MTFPPPGDLHDPGIEPGSPALQEDPLLSEPAGKPIKKKKWFKCDAKNKINKSTLKKSAKKKKTWDKISLINNDPRQISLMYKELFKSKRKWQPDKITGKAHEQIAQRKENNT